MKLQNPDHKNYLTEELIQKLSSMSSAELLSLAQQSQRDEVERELNEAELFSHFDLKVFREAEEVNLSKHQFVKLVFKGKVLGVVNVLAIPSLVELYLDFREGAEVEQRKEMLLVKFSK